MENPTLKCDLLIKVSDLKPHFNSFAEYFEHILKTAMEESGNNLSDDEIKKIIDENSFIKFSVLEIPFCFKLV